MVMENLSVDKNIKFIQNINSREYERYFSSNKEVLAILLFAFDHYYVFLDQAWLNRQDITVYYRIWINHTKPFMYFDIHIK